MTPPLLLLLLSLLLAARPGGTSARCTGCGQGAAAECPGGCLQERNGGPPEEGCAEAGGCLRKEGQPCGVYLAQCAPGLQCRPPEDELPLQALLQGRGRCRRARAPSAAGDTPKESRPRPGATRPQDGNRRDPQRNPGVSATLTRPSSGGVPDAEMGPCRKHLDSVLQQLQTQVYRGSHTLYVPNCDHQGFYRKRQCRSSQGQRRGPCWCVDRMGAPDSDGCGGPAGSSG
ncbi:insulin-like growth factor-binding protein 6 isoform X2 [Erinaceus europaeus]|uniref:Insulin-like growth factor-binding protein 6 isoform X2 n=1 Tax=Erinaceus europaeus TaxID=9365 RepID=A0A1S2ZF14_ERIEU|nr:insulin-like growth factor-binding protein 6 isoform X2 [Erinaceus europaeus]